MTGTEIALIITSLATFMTAVGGLIVSMRNGRTLNDVQIQTDGISSKLVEASSKFAAAEGTAAGIVEGHAAGLEQGRKEERK